MSEKLTTAASYTAGVGSTLFGAINLNDAAIIVGIVLSIGTFVVNFIYKRKTYLLAAKKD